MNKIISNIITFNKVIFEDIEHDKIVFENKVIWQREPNFYIEYETTSGTQYQEFATGALLRQFIMNNKTTFINHCKVVAKLPEITDCYDMFSNCSATTLDLSNFNTSNVTDMGSMFYESQATTLDLSNFNTSNVTDMSGMFYKSQATSLDLSSFDTSKVISMSWMFGYSKATSLDLSSFDTSKVTDMSSMFYESQVTTGYARTQADANRLNASSFKPAGLVFTVKLPNLRNIEVGDDLNGKTLYLDFPDNIHNLFPADADYISEVLNFGPYGYIGAYRSTPSDLIIQWQDADLGDYIYHYNGTEVTDNKNTILIEQSTYSDNSIVNRVDKTNPAYQYIKIEG